MIEENGLLVLMGSKPISEFVIDNTEEEIEGLLPKYCLRTQWEIWKQTYGNILNKQYLVVARTPKNGKREGFFVNIPNLYYILDHHYSDFVKIYGKDFFPKQIIYELGSEKSEFWDSVFSSHLAMGLVFGYGRRNAAHFSWKIENNDTTPRREAVKYQRTIDELVKVMSKRDLSVDDLATPFFCTYSEYDPVVKKYNKERKAIIKELRGKDFTNYVLKKLVDPSKTDEHFIH